MRTAAALAAGAGIAAALWPGAGPARAGESPPPCRARATVQPERAWVGQQVVYSVQIVQREDVQRVVWKRPLAFPGFRVEWLPGRLDEAAAAARDEPGRVRVERRALFGARPGLHEIPATRLRCRVSTRGGPDTDSAVYEVALPALRVRIDPVPEEGRPGDWSGLVGTARVRAVADPRAVALGGTIHLSVQVSGEGDLLAVRPPIDPDRGLPGADVFPRTPETVLDPGERLETRRDFRFDVVPRETGRFVIPAMRVPYFDPDAQRFATASTPAMAIAVTPASPSAVQADALPPEQGDDRAAERGGGTFPGALAALALAGALLGAGLWRLRRRGNPSWKAADAALEAADRAARRGDPFGEARELSRALRAALRASAPALASLDPGSLADRATSPAPGDSVDPPLLRELAAQLEALDWVRFSDEVGHPDREAARRAVARLRAAS